MHTTKGGPFTFDRYLSVDYDRNIRLCISPPLSCSTRYLLTVAAIQSEYFICRCAAPFSLFIPSRLVRKDGGYASKKVRLEECGSNVDGEGKQWGASRY